MDGKLKGEVDRGIKKRKKRMDRWMGSMVRHTRRHACLTWRFNTIVQPDPEGYYPCPWLRRQLGLGSELKREQKEN